MPATPWDLPVIQTEDIIIGEAIPGSAVGPIHAFWELENPTRIGRVKQAVRRLFRKDTRTVVTVGGPSEVFLRNMRTILAEERKVR